MPLFLLAILHPFMERVPLMTSHRVIGDLSLEHETKLILQPACISKTLETSKDSRSLSFPAWFMQNKSFSFFRHYWGSFPKAFSSHRVMWRAAFTSSVKNQRQSEVNCLLLPCLIFRENFNRYFGRVYLW